MVTRQERKPDACKLAVDALVSEHGATCENAIIAVMQALWSTPSTASIKSTEPLVKSAQQLLSNNPGLAPQHTRRLFEDLIALQFADNGRKKSAGSFYTPEYIVDYIVNATLAPLLEAAREQQAGVEPYLHLRILDAAMGSGRFLSAAAKAIANAIVADPSVGDSDLHSALKLVTENCLYGADLGRVETEASIISLCMECGGDGNTLAALRQHLRTGNALLPAGDSAIDWPGCFPEVFERQRSGFDATIGNPPWLSYSGRESAKADKTLLRQLRERWPAMKGWPSTHGAFLQLATEQCRSGGRIGQIIPEQILDLSRYWRVRQSLFTQAGLAEPPLKVDERAFDGVISPSCVIILEKASNLTWRESDVIKTRGRLCQAGLGDCDETDNLTLTIVEKMRQFPTLPQEAFGDPGVHTGNCADLLIRKAEGEGCVPLLIGRDVIRYHAANPSLWLATDPEPADGGYYRIAKTSRYDATRILIRQTAAHPIAARAKGAYFRNSLLACYGAEGFSVEYLLAVLNSKLIRLYHQHEFRDGRQKSFPQVKVSHLRSLPIPPPNETNPAIIQEIDRLVLLMEGLVGQGNSTETPSIDERIDQLVFELYGLSAEEQSRLEKQE